MRLQDRARSMLSPRRRGIPDEYVADIVDLGLQPEFATELSEEAADLFLVMRRAGDLGELIEVLPDRARLQAGDGIA